MTKKIIIEIDVDPSLELDDVSKFFIDMMHEARLKLDTKLNRIGNDSPTALQHTTIRFVGFSDYTSVYRDGLFRSARRNRSRK